MRGRAWTKQEDAILHRTPRPSDGELAKELGRNRECVRRRRNELNLPPGQPAALTAMMARINLRRLLRKARMAA